MLAGLSEQWFDRGRGQEARVARDLDEDLPQALGEAG